MEPSQGLQSTGAAGSRKCPPGRSRSKSWRIRHGVVGPGRPYSREDRSQSTWQSEWDANTGLVPNKNLICVSTQASIAEREGIDVLRTD